MSKAIRAIHYTQQPEEFLALLDRLGVDSGAITASQFVNEDRYQKAFTEGNYKNLSFILTASDEPAAVVLTHQVEDIICYNHLGVDIICPDENKKTIAEAFKVLMEQAREPGVKQIRIDDRAQGNMISLIGAEAFNNNAEPHTKLEAVIDLEKSEEDIHKGLRKSYKSLVNQGRREIDFKYVTSGTMDHDAFTSFRLFHKQVAGRVTRSQESWDVQADMINDGEAELIMGYMEPHGLVSSALFNDIGDMTVYSVAVYNRDLFDYPLAHANVYEGIMRAKARGQKIFYLGQIPPYGSVEEKEFNIGKFKKGFCEGLKTYIEWHINL